MKNCCVFISFLFSFTLNAQVFPAKDLFYSVPFNIPTPTAWWHEGLELPQQTAFIQSILNVVDSGRIDVYVPQHPYSKKLERKEVQQLLHRIDTVYPDYGYLIYGEEYAMYRYDLLPRDIFSISFHEEWEYDGKEKTFLKKVKGIILNGRLKNNNNIFFDDPLFYIRFDGKGINSGPRVTNPPKISGITYDFHTRDYHTFILPAETLFRDDPAMQKKNQAATKEIISTMLTGKKVVLYDTLYPYNKPLSKKHIAKNLPAYRAANTIRFFEDWEVDLNKMVFLKTVKGIVPGKEREYKPSGEAVPDSLMRIAFTRLAFLPLNGYVPALPLFQKTIVDGFSYREVFFKSPLVYENQTIYSDSAALMKVCTGICNLVESRTLPGYTYSTDEREPIPLTSESIAKLFAEAHKADIPASNYTSLNYNTIPFYYQTIAGLQFKESWLYDATAQTFEKQIDSITLLHVQYVMHKEGYFNLPLFTVDLPQLKNTETIMKPEFLVAKNIQSPLFIASPYLPLELSTPYDTDVAYAPQGYYRESLLESSTRYNFIQQIIDGALTGKITVYDGEKTQTVLSPSQFRTKLDSVKGLPVVADLPSDYFKIHKIIFVEDWYFNPSTGEFYKKVNEIIFLNCIEYFDPSLSYNEKQRPIFSIKLK